MKAFDKWAGPAFYYGQDPSNRPTLEAKRRAWKAALEWVLDRINYSDELFETQDYIQEELGEDEKDNGKYNNKCTK